MDDYIIWDYSVPSISFNVDSGRITIFKTTLVAMGYPEYFHFLFSPEDLAFGIEPCNIDDGGANRLPDNLSRDHYDIKSKDLVRFVFRSCGWKKKLTYRVPGVRLAPDSHNWYEEISSERDGSSGGKIQGLTLFTAGASQCQHPCQ